MLTLPDINVWFALLEPHHTHHAQAIAWLEGTTGSASVAYLRPTQQGLLRLLTTHAVADLYGNHVHSNTVAWRIQQALFADERIFLAEEPAGIEGHWQGFSGVRTASPKLWMDAYLAAFAIAGGYRLVTTDKAFKQFKGVDVLLLK